MYVTSKYIVSFFRKRVINIAGARRLISRVYERRDLFVAVDWGDGRGRNLIRLAGLKEYLLDEKLVCPASDDAHIRGKGLLLRESGLSQFFSLSVIRRPPEIAKFVHKSNHGKERGRALSAHFFENGPFRGSAREKKERKGKGIGREQLQPAHRKKRPHSTFLPSSLLQAFVFRSQQESNGDRGQPRFAGGDAAIHRRDPHLGRPKRQLRIRVS